MLVNVLTKSESCARYVYVYLVPTLVCACRSIKIILLISIQLMVSTFNCGLECSLFKYNIYSIANKTTINNKLTNCEMALPSP